MMMRHHARRTHDIDEAHWHIIGAPLHVSYLATGADEHGGGCSRAHELDAEGGGSSGEVRCVRIGEKRVEDVMLFGNGQETEDAAAAVVDDNDCHRVLRGR